MKNHYNQSKKLGSKNVCKLFATLFLCFTFGILSAQWTATSFPENEFPYKITKSPDGTLMVLTYPGTGGYIYMSKDHGETWEIADVEGAVYSATLQIDNVMFFGGRGSKIARTADNGLTWNLFNFNQIYNSPESDIYALTYHNRKIYAAVFGSGICYSEDMGETWKETDRESLMVSYEVDGRNTYTMQSFKGKLYAIGANGIWILNDENQTWTLQRETWFAGNSLILNDKLYISYVIQNGENGIEFTEDGETWQEIPNNDSLPSFDIRGFKTDGKNIFVGFMDQGVSYTPDEGETWIATQDWPAYLEIPGVVIFLSIPMDFCFLDGEIFAASYEKGIYKMTNPNPPTSVNELSDNKLKCYINHNEGKNSMTISFSLENSANTTLSIFDMMGREVQTLNFGDLSSGLNTKDFDITKLQSAGYIYVLRAGDDVARGKFIISK